MFMGGLFSFFADKIVGLTWHLHRFETARRLNRHNSFDAKFQELISTAQQPAGLYWSQENTYIFYTFLPW